MNHPGGRRVFYIPLVTAISSLTLLFVAAANGWLGEWSGAGRKFCEAARPGLIKQPVNTWSNLGFVFVGLLAGWKLWRGAYAQNKNALTQNTFYAAFFASLGVLIGPCSMAMHATETELGGLLDLASMYLIASFITAYSCERYFRLSTASFLAVFAAVMVICLTTRNLPYKMPLVGSFGTFIFGVFIITGTIFEMLNSFVRKLDHDFLWGAFSAGFILLAFVIWNFSLTGGPCCQPYSVLQGHAIWHLLCAASLYFLFRYYVSEHSESVE